MKGVRKAFALCFTIHAVLILVLAINKILSIYDNILLPIESWRGWCLFLMLSVVSVTCMMLFMPQLSRNLKRIDPEMHDSVFKYGFIDYNSISPLFFAFSKKSNNDELNKIKTYTKRYYFLWALYLVEGFLILI